MIIGGKIDVDESGDEVYYSKNVDSQRGRKKAKTKALQDFHSYVKKNLIVSSSKEGDNLLDISCGRGGDFNHWIEAKLGKVVGIDINRENLENTDSGACNRILDNYNKNALMDNILFIWGNSVRDFTNGDAGKDELNKYYLDIIYGNVSLEKIPNDKLKKFYNIVSEEDETGFDVVSCQFSFHYFFKNEVDLRSVLRNVSNSLIKGGKFIGTCLDGKLIFDMLKNEVTVNEYDDDTLLWKITKRYKSNTFESNYNSLGLPIDVYMDSIGKSFTEYLVNFDYLGVICEEFDLKLVKLIDFSDLFMEMTDSKINYGNAGKMDAKLKKYSFLNKCFVLEKI
jgi:mRNA (guanine-N7-)-methyltransferase